MCVTERVGELSNVGGCTTHAGVGMLGCSGASDVAERLFMPGALHDMAAGSTVGGEGVPAKVVEGVEDKVDVGEVDSVVSVFEVCDTATGTVVSGCIFHAAGVSCCVKVVGRYIAVTVRNKGLATGGEVESVTEFAMGLEASIGLMCSKVGMV